MRLQDEIENFGDVQPWDFTCDRKSVAALTTCTPVISRRVTVASLLCRWKACQTDCLHPHLLTLRGRVKAVEETFSPFRK